MEVADQGARAGVPPFHPLRSMWENERVVPIFDDDIDSISQGDKQQQQQQQILMEDGILGPGVPGVLPSSRARRSNWRMESRYAELLVANSEFPFCAWDATTYVPMRMLCHIEGLVQFNQPSHHPYMTHTHTATPPSTRPCSWTRTLYTSRSSSPSPPTRTGSTASRRGAYLRQKYKLNQSKRAGASIFIDIDTFPHTRQLPQDHLHLLPELLAPGPPAHLARRPQHLPGVGVQPLQRRQLPFRGR